MCVCVCGAPPACLALSVRPPAPLEPLLLAEPPGLEGTGAELWSLPATGVAGSLQEPGSWAAVWGQKQRFFPPPPKKFPFPRWVFKLCKYLEKRYLLLLLAWCHCFREGGEGGAGPFQQRPQEPHTPFYKKYTNILLTFLHRFFFPPLPLQVKTTPLSYFFFSYVQRAPRAGHATIYRLCTEAGLALQLLLQLQHVQGGHFGHLKEEPGRKSKVLELGRAPPQLKGGWEEAHLCEYLVRTAFSLSQGW